MTSDVRGGHNVLLVLLIAWLVLMTLVFLLLPVFSRERAAGGGAVCRALTTAPVDMDREALAAALREVTWDYDLGNIAPEEFRALEAQYRQRLEASEAKDVSIEAEVEAEVDKARERLREGPLA